MRLASRRSWKLFANLGWLGVAAVVATLTSACGDETGGTCAAASGAYQLTVTPQSPNHCAITAGSVVVTFPGMTLPDCAITQTISPDGCSSEFDQTCPGDVPGTTTRFVGKITWNKDASAASGLVTYQYTDGATCTSTTRWDIRKL